MLDKPFEQKNILERHTYTDGKFNLAAALCELEIRFKNVEERLQGAEQALEFFVSYYKQKEGINILIPEHLNNEIQGKSGLIL